MLSANRGGILPGPHPETLSTFRRYCDWLASSAIVAILSPFLALTNASVQKVLLAIVVLDIPIEFGTHFFYNESLAKLGAMGGLSVSSGTIALAGLYTGWIVESLAKKKQRARAPLHVSKSLVAYLFFIGISVFIAQDTSLSLFEACLYFETFLLYIYVANRVRTKQDVLFIVSLLLLGCLIESLVMIAMRILVTPATTWNGPIHLHVEDLNSNGIFRVGGTVGSPNTTAGYLSVLLSLALGVFFTNLKGFHKTLALAVLALGGIALILTFSRGGWLALFVSAVTICFAVVRRRRLSLKRPVAIVVILVLLYLPFHAAISSRLFGNDNGSAESRIPLMHLAYRIFDAHPLFGVGANNFTVAMDPFLTPEFRHGFLYAVHDKYLLVLCETGIGGLLAFLAFLVAALRHGWRCWKLNDSFMAPIALGLFAGVLGHMIHMNVDVFRGRPIQELVWLIAALLVAMLRIAKGSTPAAPCTSPA